ncbi:hypothetical protein M0802_003597 [Mischocyttarus mexicanus]|nr:hypothetical protein M0802_003597 [Mischocyttarus mexicanus]
MRSIAILIKIKIKDKEEEPEVEVEVEVEVVMEIAHEPPKLKTTLKIPPKQATNPLQFVKVGPCSLYRTAQEQLQKVQEVKKIKQEVRDDPEDWQSNLDNWKSSRRKRQEHIIERVVEVKKLELEEHDRQRRRSKTFSEMMEERGNRGRKLSISLAMYHEEDANDLSDLGIGTSSGKSSVSGDTHDDAHSVLEYDSATTATASSPEPEEYTYEGAIRGYVSRVSQNIPRRSLVNLDVKLDNAKSSTNGSKTSLNDDSKVTTTGPVVKVDILKRREIFEKGTQKSSDQKTNNRLSGDFTSTKSIKERLSNLEKQKIETENNEKVSNKALNRLSGDMSSIRERLSHLEKQAIERESNKTMITSGSHKVSSEELESVRPLRDRLSTLEKYSSSDESSAPQTTIHESRHNGELTARTIKDRLNAFDAIRSKESTDKRVSSSIGKHSLCFRDQENRIDNSTPSERSSSPDSEYRAPRAAFHRSLDSLDADASSGPDTFERVQSLEEFDYGRRYPASSSSAELLNDTDREDSGIHTADVSCSVSQADEPVDEEIVHASTIIEEKPEDLRTIEATSCSTSSVQENNITTKSSTVANESTTTVTNQQEAVATKDTAETSSGERSTNKSCPHMQVEVNTNSNTLPTANRPIVYQSPRVPPRRTPPETLPKPKLPLLKDHPTDSVNNNNNNNNETLPISKDTEDKNSSPISIEDNPLSSIPSTSTPSNLPLESSTNNNVTTTTTFPIQDTSKTTRTASKIPTPLPRKTLSSQHPTTSQQEPIIFMEKENDEKNAETICQTTTSTSTTMPDLEERESIEISINTKLDTTMTTTTTTTTKNSAEVMTIDTPDSPTSPIPIILGLKRPTSLNFNKTEISNIDTINCLSPISPQQFLPLSLSNDEEIVTGLTFPLGPPTTVEPPKEKPPPPPVDDISDEEAPPVEPLKRLNSTRRIKKELRTRRSDFLGIEGVNDDDLERELTLMKPPDMAAILAEERRIEQLHRRSYDTDSNYEQDSSHERDSGVELGHVEDWMKQPVSPDMSQHSRQSSEPFGASVTSSEEDEITKKEREIIEVLEKEEQWRYGNNHEHNRIQNEIEEKERRAADVRRKEEIRIRAMESQIREQENTITDNNIIPNYSQNKILVGAGLNNNEDEFASGEVLRVERELLQLEQEELKRQRNNLAYREQKQLKLAEQLQEQWKSLQDVAHGSSNISQQYKHQPAVNYRSSMPNLQLQDAQRRRPPPPPIPPTKPLRHVEQRQRDVTIRNSRVPSADSIPQQVDASLRHSASATTLSCHAGQQMTRQTLQALSAAPRPRIVQGDQWVQRRKSDVPRGVHDFNYQHWLIQEAEQRRIHEKNQRSPARKSQQHVTGTSVPYAAAPTRSDSKPLPDSIIQTLTQRVQNRAQEKPLSPRRRLEHSTSQEHIPLQQHSNTNQQLALQQKPQQPPPPAPSANNNTTDNQEKMLSVSGKKKCSHCGDELEYEALSFRKPNDNEPAMLENKRRKKRDSDNRDKKRCLGRSIMSLRWIHENLKAPTCDEECSDIDDSCSDDSYDTDLYLYKKDSATIEEEKKKGLNGDSRKHKLETRKHQNTIVTFDENSQPRYETSEVTYTLSPYVIWDPRQPAENPIYNSLVIKLYCRTGYHLAITSTGKILGLSGANERHALLHVTPVSFGVVRIQGVETQLYLAFNKKGYLYGESNMNKDNTEWEQWSVGSYDAFRSRKYVHPGWWIGIKKNGRAKSGPRTVWGQKAIQFLAIRQD